MRLRLAVACAVIVALAATRPPVLDEEVYLNIAAQLQRHPWRPYDWWRPMQPWGDDPAPDAFLFAHPPLHLLWVSLWTALLPWGPALRLAVAAPFALLLGAAAGDLLHRESPRAQRGAWLWLASPILWLALQSGLMIDLGVVALSTAALAARLRAQEEPHRPGWEWAEGALLGLACLWKYPALILVFVLTLDALRTGRRPWRAIFTFGLIFGGAQLGLAAVYGEPHLLHVLTEAAQISRGPLGGRALGAVARLGVALSPILLLALGIRWRIAVIALAAPLTLIALQEGAYTLVDHGLMALFLIGGLSALGVAVSALTKPGRSWLYGAWALAAVIGVIVGHNYASGRYLLPAILPLAILGAEQLSRRWMILGALPWFALSVATSVAEHRQAQAAVNVVAQLTAAQPTPGVFTGEWTARWALSRAGWRFVSPGAALPPGTRYAEP
ncbi:MAG: Dolichyl-phosphate-mannose-protein mannosyltransferase, partial [Pseudomonadota bacterium]